MTAKRSSAHEQVNTKMIDYHFPTELLPAGFRIHGSKRQFLYLIDLLRYVILYVVFETELFIIILNPDSHVLDMVTMVQCFKMHLFQKQCTRYFSIETEEEAQG